LYSAYILKLSATHFANFVKLIVRRNKTNTDPITGLIDRIDGILKEVEDVTRLVNEELIRRRLR
jgi:hypothetical protein